MADTALQWTGFVQKAPLSASRFPLKKWETTRGSWPSMWHKVAYYQLLTGIRALTLPPRVIVFVKIMHSTRPLLIPIMVALAVVPCIGSPISIAEATQGETPSSRSFQSLASRVAQVQDVQLVRELRITWTESPSRAGANVAARESPTFGLIAQRVVPGHLRRERFPQLSQDRLVVVVQDASGGELDWRLVPNPTLVRAEAPGPDGRLQGTVLELGSMELSIAIPAIQDAHQILLYRPYWNGDEYFLEPLGQVQIQP